MSAFTTSFIQKITAGLAELNDFVFLETCKTSKEDHKSLLFLNPVCWLELKVGDDVVSFLSSLDAWRERGYKIAGWFGYEVAYALEPALTGLINVAKGKGVLAQVGVFDQVTIFDHEKNDFTLPQDLPLADFVAPAGELIYNLQSDIDEDSFCASVDRIKEYIAAGDVYQVNYTFKLNFDLHANLPGLYCQLRRNQSVSYGGWLRCSGVDRMSFSPELFFSFYQGDFKVRPMKGTRKRGRTLAEDGELASKMTRDSKTICENVMIVDLLRNDLGRYLYCSGGGDVQVRSLFDIERYESLLQMTSTVVGKPCVSSFVRLSEIFPAIFPCGSVTGAPKIRSMEVIRELEKKDRGVYCGAIGWADKDEVCFNVPIRTLVVDGKKGYMGVGAGIVHDSQPKEEWQECLLKGRFLTANTKEFKLIETFLWQKEAGYFLLDLHLSRLRDSADYFLFSFPTEKIESVLRQEENNFTKEKMRLRLLLAKDGSVEVCSFVLPDSHVVDNSSREKIGLSSSLVDRDNPFFYHKTTNRYLFNVKRKLADELGLAEIIFMNHQSELTEGTISSLFLEMSGRLYTPPLSSGLLPGVYRQMMLDSHKVKEKKLYAEDLYRADRIFIANSVRGMREVELVQETV